DRAIKSRQDRPHKPAEVAKDITTLLDPGEIILDESPPEIGKIHCAEEHQTGESDCSYRPGSFARRTPCVARSLQAETLLKASFYLPQRCPRPQTGQPTIVIVAGAAQRYTQPRGDVAQTQLFETGELQGRPLSGRQLRQAGSNHPPALLSCQFR